MSSRSYLRRRIARLAAPAVLALAGAGLSTSAQATAMATGSASATLEVLDIACTEGVDPCDLAELSLVLDSNFVSLEDAFDVGSAAASAVGSAIPDPATPIPLGIGDTIVNAADTTATADPAGLADAIVLTDMAILLENLSLDDVYEIFFSVDYGVSTSASVMDPFIELAFADAIVEIFDDLGDVDEVFEVFADSDFGPPADSDSDTVSFSLLLLPGEINALTMFVDSNAFALSIPEPGALGLLGIGVLGLGFARRARIRSPH